MGDNKDQIAEKDDETVTPAQEGTQETSAPKERPNIAVITARNEEEAKQDRKSSYRILGIVALLVAVSYTHLTLPTNREV